MNAGSTRTKFCVFRERYDRQRTLVIRIAAITLASDSAITIARFRPSKVLLLTSILMYTCKHLRAKADQQCAFQTVTVSETTLRHSGGKKERVITLAGLTRRFTTPHSFNARDLNAGPGPKGSLTNHKETLAIHFSSASVLLRKALSGNLFWGPPP